MTEVYQEPVQSIVVLISGTGTNLQALIDATASSPPSIPGARISLVISNRKAAPGMERAHRANIPTETFALRPFLNANPGQTRIDYDQALIQRILLAKPNLIVLAGFMHILSSQSLEGLKKDGIPIINLHPALPGAFDGTDAIARAHAAFLRGEITKTGVMVHEVVAEVDRGKVIEVRDIELRFGETLEELTARVHEVEHDLLVKSVRDVLTKFRPRK